MDQNIIFEIAFFSAVVSVILLVWFRSDALAEYLEVLGLDIAFGVREYRKASSEVSYHMRYTDFLLLKYNSFFIRLITCPLCLSVWVSVIISATRGWELFPFLVVLPLIIYNHLEEKL
jgi:hypothetical protein